MSNNISSANSIFKISIPLLSIINVSLQGYAADNAFSIDTIQISENRIGVDGLKSAGYTPQLYVQNISLQADSPSIIIFETLYQATVLSKGVYFIDAIIQLPAVQKSYALAQGTLENYTPIPSAQRVLEPQQFSINWGTVVVAPI